MKKWKALEKQCMDYMNLKKILYLHLTTHVKREIGGKFYNFSIPGMTGWPDFIIFEGDNTVYFVECKTGKGRLSKEQIKIKERLESAGFMYTVVKTFEQFKEFIEF